jgi:hypothetical protein
MGPFVMGPFVMGPLVMGPYVGEGVVPNLNLPADRHEAMSSSEDSCRA